MLVTARCISAVLGWNIIAILFFFAVNLALYRAGLAVFNRHKVSVMDMLHFTVVTYFSVGYGDMYPVNDIARIASWANMATFFILAAITTS